MHALYVKVAAVDASAGEALKVIAYFDRLVEQRASLEALVRGAAVLSGGPACLEDRPDGVRIRVDASGRRADDGRAPDPAWPCAELVPGGAARLWLEAPASPDPVAAMVLERAAAAVRVVMDRTPAPAAGADLDKDALVRRLLDPRAPEAQRLRAAAGLGLRAGDPARAVAPWHGPPEVEPAPVGGVTRPRGDRREGVGPAVPVLDLPASWAAAKTAVLFTAEGTADDPGRRSVSADELGSGLTLLAAAVADRSRPPEDAVRIERLIGGAPWMAATLHGLVSSASVRHAAQELTVHHSTLQARVEQIERKLGWSVRDTHGRLRLLLALSLWRLHRNRDRV